MNTRALVAEFIGTFTLIFIGAGAGRGNDPGSSSFRSVVAVSLSAQWSLVQARTELH